MARVSVVIPTRDRAELVEGAISSALQQDGVDLEVLVVDDCSSDRTEAVVGAVGDERVRYIRQEHHGGVAAARNRGLADASAEWVAFLDDDDRWKAPKLAQQLAKARSVGAEWVWTAALVLDEERGKKYVHPAPSATTVQGDLRTANVIPAGASSVLATAASLRGLGGFDESLSHLADWDLWIRLPTRSGVQHAQSRSSNRSCTSGACIPPRPTARWPSSATAREAPRSHGEAFRRVGRASPSPHREAPARCLRLGEGAMALPR